MRSKTGFELPENWMPSPKDVLYGRSLGLSDQQIEDIAERMRLWAGANAHRSIARKSNWSMNFRSWLWKGKDENGQRGSVLTVFDRLERQLTSGDDNASGADDILSLPSR